MIPKITRKSTMIAIWWLHLSKRLTQYVPFAGHEESSRTQFPAFQIPQHFSLSGITRIVGRFFEGNSAGDPSRLQHTRHVYHQVVERRPETLTDGYQLSLQL